MRLIFYCIAFLCSTRWLLADTTANKSTNEIAVKAGRLIDLVIGIVLENQVILVKGEVICSVWAQGSPPVPAKAEIIDLRNAAVLPGLIGEVCNEGWSRL
jgi:imidazolonepropionase-like amidohydrolase